jgi:hypothetical protein
MVCACPPPPPTPAPAAQPAGRPVYLVEMKGKLVDNFDSRDPLDHGIGPTGVRLRPLGQVTTIK